MLDREDEGLLNNYAVIMEHPRVSLAHMLNGPTAMPQNKVNKTNQEEGYISQEVLTDEKYIFLYFRGLQLLQFLY